MCRATVLIFLAVVLSISATATVRDVETITKCEKVIACDSDGWCKNTKQCETVSCERELPETPITIGPFPMSEVAQQVADAEAGTTVLIEDGVWQFPVKLNGWRAKGGAPIVVRPVTPGGIRLVGGGSGVNSAWLEISGNIIVSGFDLDGLVITAGTYPILFRGCDTCRLTNSKIHGIKPTSGVQEWARLWNSVRIDHTEWFDKDNLGEMIRLVDGHGPYRIDHNRFGPFIRIPFPQDPGEVIRIGSGDPYNEIPTVTMIDYNLFEDVYAESEIISSKASDVTMRNNTVRNSFGHFSCRSGDRCIVDGNYFISEDGGKVGGVHAFGEDHQITNNTFVGTYAQAIVLGAGVVEGDCVASDGVIRGNVATNRAVVTGNSFHATCTGTPSRLGTCNISIDFRLGQNYPGSCVDPAFYTLEAQDMVIQDNDGIPDPSGALDSTNACLGPNW